MMRQIYNYVHLVFNELYNCLMNIHVNVFHCRCIKVAALLQCLRASSREAYSGQYFT